MSASPDYLPPEYEALLLPSWRSEAAEAERREKAERKRSLRWEVAIWLFTWGGGAVLQRLHWDQSDAFRIAKTVWMTVSFVFLAALLRSTFIACRQARAVAGSMP